jgi:hypothetical protein
MKAVYTLAAAVGLILGAAAPAAAQPDGKRELLTVLEDIGCKVTSSADVKGGKIYYAEYTANGRTYNLEVSLSENKSRVWVGLPLAKVSPAAASANADALFKLLELNQDVGPCHFKIIGSKLYLSGAGENRDIANHRVRDLVEKLIADTERTRKHWDRDWTKPVSATGFRGRD